LCEKIHKRGRSRATSGRVGTVERTREHRTRQRPLLKRAVELRLRGLSYEDIADRLGVAKSTVHQQLSGVFDLLDPEKIAAYREHRVSLLDAVECKMLSALADDERLGKASLNNAAYAFTQVHQARRLEAGQSTQNLSLHELIERVERDRARTRATTRSAGALEPGSEAAQVPANADPGR